MYKQALHKTIHLSCRGHNRKFTGFPNPIEPVKVISSQSNCPYENLAFEEYIYKNIRLEVDQRLLFMWRNRPSVTIGCHQNPWLEVDVEQAEKEDVLICRRPSDGGAFYNDLGNINLTIYTDSTIQEHKKNNEFILDTFNGTLSLTYDETKNALFKDDHQVSGSAKKAGGQTSYYHCSLLCNSDIKSLSNVLINPFNSNLDRSSFPVNIFDHGYNYLTLCNLFNQEFKNFFSPFQPESDYVVLNPIDFESVSEATKKLKDWQWIYEKTPDFTTSNIVEFQNGDNCGIRLNIEKGIIVKASISHNVSNNDIGILKFLLSKLESTRYSYKDLVSVLLSENEDSGYNIQRIRP